VPYIVTTWPECLACLDPGTNPHHVAPPLSRRAVATLEVEPLADVLRPLLRHSLKALQWVDMMNTLTALPESGGTVGPLPDGTTIQVEPTTYHALWHAVPWDSGLRGGAFMETEYEQNIAGFNAWHANGQSQQANA
jgi:hypothetical protein